MESLPLERLGLKPVSRNGEILRTVIHLNSDGSVDAWHEAKFSERELFALYYRLERWGA